MTEEFCKTDSEHVAELIGAIFAMRRIDRLESASVFKS